MHACCVLCISAYAVAMQMHGKDFRLEWVEAGHSSDDKQVTQEQQQMRMEFAVRVLETIGQSSKAMAVASARL